jgi:hypothetical protein
MVICHYSNFIKLLLIIGVLDFVLHLLIVNFFCVVSVCKYKLIKPNHVNLDVMFE